ncbi:ABC transporter ATP-binding protein [Parasphingorhabdus sp. DH2-15]|uniref:ABC transporter ATP-binding protein n=1 Tax=Parasphingorhabdus sp. DH2-15 TaxID=3444112 RepID=UPI003F6833BE
MASAGKQQMGAREALRWMMELLRPERPFFIVAIIYGIGVSILSLATPISVQMLINSVANTALVTPLFTLAGALLFLLLIAVLLSALRVHVMEIFARRFYARMVADITLKAIYARNPFFQDARQEDLFNRYFDVVTVQKAVPSLLIGLFTIILQAGVGFAVTSFYHPFFLAFNMIVVLLSFLILVTLTRGAIRSGLALSHKKYEAARWLENVGTSNGFYKSHRHVGYAMDKSEDVTKDYIAARRLHFRYSYAQTIAFLLLYAFASATLLALGGWLVIQESLSIGQLVAAELILSAAFFGLGQIGAYLDTTYDLVAASEEIGLIVAEVEQEETGHDVDSGNSPSHDGALRLRRVDLEHDDIKAHFDFTIPAGSKLIARGEDTPTKRLFTHALKRHILPSSGMITLGGEDVSVKDTFSLRSEVIVLDRANIVETTIREYLGLASPNMPSSKMLELIDQVGLGERVTCLRDGLDTVLSASGWPLSFAEVMQLKLASALCKEPNLLVLSPLFDMLDPEMLTRITDNLASKGSSIIYFSFRNAQFGDNAYLWLGKNKQIITNDHGEFMHYALNSVNDGLPGSSERPASGSNQ